MSEPIELFDWAAYKFGQFEYRLVGYVNSRGIISEPIIYVGSYTGLVETANGISFKPTNRIQTVDKMDMMYVLDRWCNLNEKGMPAEATNMIYESLTATEEKDIGEKIQREEDVTR